VIARRRFSSACDRVVSGYVGGLPGVHAMFAGVDFAWHRVIRRGDEITSEARLKTWWSRDQVRGPRRQRSIT